MLGKCFPLSNGKVNRLFFQSNSFLTVVKQIIKYHKLYNLKPYTLNFIVRRHTLAYPPFRIFLLRYYYAFRIIYEDNLSVNDSANFCLLWNNTKWPISIKRERVMNRIVRISLYMSYIVFIIWERRLEKNQLRFWKVDIYFKYGDRLAPKGK